jgi:mycothiol synthase
VITHEWFEKLPDDRSGEVAEMLLSAIEYDAEAGFSTARPDAPGGDAETRHLLVSMPPKGERGSPDLDRLPEVAVVAYLRLDVGDGVGDVQLVVRPEFRSRGVATLLFERLAERADGWTAVSGLRRLRGWSHGGHPAAQRLSWRFGADQERELFKTLRFVGGARPFASDSPVEATTSHAAEEAVQTAVGHLDAIAPSDRRLLEGATDVLDVAGSTGHVRVGAPVEDDVSTLLEAGLLAAQKRGARVVQLYVEVTDDGLLHVSRELGFFHDQSDRLFTLDLPA